MASVLKRKRGQVDVADTPKRAKSVITSAETESAVIGDKAGWSAAFPTPVQELVETNGSNGKDTISADELDFDQFHEWGVREEEKQKRAVDHDAAQKALRKAIKRREALGWKLSESIGGRMINADPIFTAGEEYVATF